MTEVINHPPFAIAIPGTMDTSVDIILLASGFSARFGPENKLLRPFHGKSLVGYALDLACSLRLGGEVLFVHAVTEVGSEAGGRPVRKIFNAHPEHGLRESVRLGVETSSASYYLFIPCDQPFLDRATIETIVSRRLPGRIVSPRCRGKPGNPTLFSAFFRQELLSLADGESPRLLKRRHADRVDWVEFENPRPFRDIDTTEDFQALAEIF